MTLGSIVIATHQVRGTKELAKVISVRDADRYATDITLVFLDGTEKCTHSDQVAPYAMLEEHEHQEGDRYIVFAPDSSVPPRRIYSNMGEVESCLEYLKRRGVSEVDVCKIVKSYEKQCSLVEL